MTLPLWPQQDLGPVRRGDIFALGRHRLACIDATNKADVARLFDGRRPTLVVTSPPYADARDYNDPIPCWNSMMLGALDGHAFADDVQMLVNLGVLHRKGEWWPYWWQWMSAMRGQQWSYVAQYIWHKKRHAPGFFGARLLPAHEFIHHLHKQTVTANKIVPCKAAGIRRVRSCPRIRKTDGNSISEKRRPIAAYRVPESVISIASCYRTESVSHPAQMPVELASFLTRTWKKANCVVYDPFGGSGTLAHAAEQEGVDSVIAEISPAYVQIAIDRWRKMHPDKPVTRVS